ncbi:porin [Jannaschia sp. KMU-145]|uniref:porin n=1 Tax=Jannaschia halovivens TaxID=3388667 RepID=UPI00396B4441
MKKVLFASTALVALTGVAAADVTISGNAEMGIRDAGGFTYGAGTAVAANTDVGFFTDIDVTFTMAGETDGGLTFGATIDLDESDDGDAFGDATQGGETIFISGAFGTLTAGDTDGALDWALQEVNFAAGSIDDAETGHTGFNGNAGLDGLYDGQIVRYDYSFGDFGIAVSAELDDTQYPSAASADIVDTDDVFGLGMTYQLDFGGAELGLGAGFQTASVNLGAGDIDLDTYGLSINSSFAGGWQAGLSYMSYENHFPFGGTAATATSAATTGLDDALGVTDTVGATTVVGGRILTNGFDTDHIGVGVGYTTGAISVGVNYGKYDHDAGPEAEGYGIAANYDLGGGAIIQLGYGHSEVSGGAFAPGINVDNDTVSFGVRMNF